MSTKWTDEQVEAVVDEISGQTPHKWFSRNTAAGGTFEPDYRPAAWLILEARDERDKAMFRDAYRLERIAALETERDRATLAEQDTERQYLVVCRERDAAIGRVKERDARDVYRLERIAALKTERDAALARAQQLEMLNDPEAGAKQMLMQRLAALEAENAEMRQRTAELEAERSRWTYASPGHLKALSYECAKLGVAVRLAGFTPPEQHVRIAENERLRGAFEKWQWPAFGPGVPPQYAQGYICLIEKLRAAVDGK